MALAAHAQSWELGSTELFPTSEEPLKIATAASRHAHLVVWTEDPKYTSAPPPVYAARYSPDGELLDSAGLFLGETNHESPLVATDGEDFLVAWYSERDWGLRTTRITANGEVIDGASERSARPRALAFNGRTYAMATDSSIVLLDRHGIPVSGRLTADFLSLIAREGKWIVIRGERWQEIGESDFPPVGQQRGLTLANQFEQIRGRHFAIAATADGFVTASACYCYPAKITIRRLDRDGRPVTEDIERPNRRSAPMSFNVRGDVDEIHLVVDGDDVYVAYHARYPGAGLVRIRDGHLREIVPQSPRGITVSIAPFGIAAFWIDPEDEQLYAARLSGAELSEPARRVSKHLPEQLHSMLVSGAGVHLALWKEYSRDRYPTLYALLADEGKPITPPRVLSEYGGYGVTAASDGSSFLMVWEEDADTFGSCILAPDGTITSGPFEIAHLPDERPGSLVWDGKSSYILHLDWSSALLRFARDGQFAGRIDLPEIRGVSLHPVNDGFLGLVYDEYWPRCTCGVSVHVRTVVLDRDLVSDPLRDEPWRGETWEWSSWTGASAVAVGGEHRLLVRDDWDPGLYAAGDDGEMRQLPYEGSASFYWEVTAGWTGEEFLVAHGDVLGHHAPDGAFLRVSALPPGTIRSSITADAQHVPILLVERIMGPVRRLVVMRLQETASPESARAPR